MIPIRFDRIITIVNDLRKESIRLRCANDSSLTKPFFSSSSICCLALRISRNRYWMMAVMYKCPNSFYLQCFPWIYDFLIDLFCCTELHECKSSGNSTKYSNVYPGQSLQIVVNYRKWVANEPFVEVLHRKRPFLRSIQG